MPDYTQFKQARLKIAAPTLAPFDPTAYQQRIGTIAAGQDQILADAQQRAAARKVAQQRADDQARADAQAAAQARIDARIKASAAKTQGYQAQTYQQYQQQNTPLKTTMRNPNFPGGTGGQLVAVGGTASKKAAGIINEALKYRGMMYQWGGSTPQSSFDCSGLVQWAYRSMGVALPRVSNAQANSGRKVPLNNLRPGDLVAWDNSSRNTGADHIAIYIGNGQIIEAPHTGAQIRVRKLGNEQNAWGVQILK
jgi:cell wall-associated NlpC family hydrolase